MKRTFAYTSPELSVEEKRKTDAYCFSTSSASEMKAELVALQDETQLINIADVSKLHVEVVSEEEDFYEKQAQNPGLDQTVYIDTRDGGTQFRLYDESSEEEYYLRDTAIMSLHETSRIEGGAFALMPQDMAADIYSRALSVNRGTRTMVMRSGKCSAIFTSSHHEAMAQTELFDIAENALKDKFGSVTFRQGTVTHWLTRATWELTDAKVALLDRYKQAIMRARSGRAVSTFYPIDDMTPAVEFLTSDTGFSCAELCPLLITPGGHRLSLVSSIKVKHTKSTTGKSNLDNFKDAADTIFARFQDTEKIIENMAKTPILNPKNCIVGLAGQLRISKRYASAAYEQMETFEPICGANGVTAFDVYLCLAEAVKEAERNPYRGGKLTMGREKTVNDIEEALAKSLKLDYRDFDIPGVVAWKY